MYGGIYFEKPLSGPCAFAARALRKVRGRGAAAPRPRRGRAAAAPRPL